MVHSTYNMSFYFLPLTAYRWNIHIYYHLPLAVVINNISAAWAVDREFVHILGPSGEVSNLFWHDFELFWLSGVCSGLSRSTLRWICGEG